MFRTEEKHHLGKSGKHWWQTLHGKARAAVMDRGDQFGSSGWRQWLKWSKLWARRQQPVSICAILDLALSLFPAALKSVLPFPTGKRCGKIFLMETWASHIRNDGALMASIYWTICFLRSQFVFLFPHLFLPAFVLVFRHFNSHNQSQQSSSYKLA